MKRKIKILKSKFNLTPEDIASFVGVSTKSVYRWEKGRTAHRSFVKKIDELISIKIKENGFSVNG